MEKITSILVHRLSKYEEFISIIDWDSGYCELRRNDPGPFGFPLDEINPGEMFSIEIDTQPGQMTCSVYKCEPSEYTKLLSNELVISGIEKMCLITRADVETTAQKLRDTKIDTILK